MRRRRKKSAEIFLIDSMFAVIVLWILFSLSVSSRVKQYSTIISRETKKTENKIRAPPHTQHQRNSCSGSMWLHIYFGLMTAVDFVWLNWNSICYSLSDLCFWCAIRTLCSLAVFFLQKYVSCRGKKAAAAEEERIQWVHLVCVCVWMCVWRARRQLVPASN